MNESTQKTVTNYRRLLDGTDEIMSKWIDAARANPEPTDPAQVTSIVLSIRRAVDIRRILAAWENTPDPNEDEESDWDREDDKRINKLIGEALLQEALKRHKNDWGKVAEECEYMGPPEFTMEYALNFKHPYKPPYHFLPEDLRDLADPECDDDDCDDEDPDSPADDERDDEALDCDADDDCHDEALDCNKTDRHHEDWSSEAPPTNGEFKNWTTTTTTGTDFRIPGVPPIPPPQPSSLTFTLPKSISTTPATPPTTTPSTESTSPTTSTESTPSTMSTTSTSSTTSTESTPSTTSTSSTQSTSSNTTTPEPPDDTNSPTPTNSTTPQYRAPPTS